MQFEVLPISDENSPAIRHLLRQVTAYVTMYNQWKSGLGGHGGIIQWCPTHKVSVNGTEFHCRLDVHGNKYSTLAKKVC